MTDINEKQKPTTDAYRDGWELAFGEKKRDPNETLAAALEKTHGEPPSILARLRRRP